MIDRRGFLKSCGYACLGGAAMTALLQSCAEGRFISGELIDSNVYVNISDFQISKKGQTTYRNHLIIQNEKLKYPIALFRYTESEYSALLMQCTHQGAELQVFGDKLVCAAHGSEFSDKGLVAQGPAEVALRSFPVNIESNKLRISLT
jgi:Rieske Fe-S protein